MVVLSKKPDKIRISLTLVKANVETLDQLVEDGIYMSRQTAIRAGMRLLFRHHKLEPFTARLPEGPQ